MNIGVIGYGYWGPNVVRNLLLQEGVNVLVIADANPDQLIQAFKTYPNIGTTVNPNDLFHSPAIDSVVIATPVNTHYPLVKAALMHGKHVLVEKPLAGN